MKFRDTTAPLTEIYDLLYRLGLTADSVCFFHTAYAVWLCVQQPERLQLVTKWLYPEVAKHYKTTWSAVERNIRRATTQIWDMSASRLSAIARCPLPERPRTARFLAILAACIPPTTAA